MGNDLACIASIGCAVPPYSIDQGTAGEMMRQHFRERLNPGSLDLMRSFFSHPSIRKRHFAVDDAASVFEEHPDRRIERFTEKSVELAAEAVGKALEEAGAGVRDVGGIVVNTCTGYICPGISTYLIERLGLSRSIRAYDMVGSGCSGAIPNLQAAEAMLRAGEGEVVVSVSVEICSALFQMDNDLSLILSNALFGDGAAAAVLWGKPEGLELVASAGRYYPEQRDELRLVHKNGELHNRISLRLPGLVKRAAAEVVSDVLASRNLRISDVAHWALHTGGEKIINAVRDEVGIPEDLLPPTRKVLAEYGNMSSPTVLFVLKDILAMGIDRGDWCVLLAYGAGLSAHAYLLRKQ